MVLQPYLVEVDAVVRVLDAGVGQMLVAIAQVEGALRSETIAHPDVVAELEQRAHALVPDGGMGLQVPADAKLRVESLEIVTLQAQHRGQADLRDLVVVPGEAVVLPVAQPEVPVAPDVPVRT